MEFFDSKQEVIDIRLTQFGKNLLARGFFKPVYYQFFDDDIIYNSEYVGFSEEQNDTEKRILLETPRLKTQYTTIGIETSFDQEQKEIEEGKEEAYKEITKNQDPTISEKMLKYPLNNSEINSQEAPRFKVGLHGPKIVNVSDFVNVKGIDLPIPQLNITSSYTIIRDVRHKIPKIPKYISDSENYVDLSSDQIEFLDKTKIKISKEDMIIDLDEFAVDLALENFELEIFEVVEETQKDGSIKENLLRLDTKEKIKKYFDIRKDNMVQGNFGSSRDGRKAPNSGGKGIL